MIYKSKFFKTSSKLDFGADGVIELRRTLNHYFSEICTS